MIYMSKEREDGSRDCILSGVVTKDVKLDTTPTKGMPKVTFTVNAGNKRYINCLALGDSTVTQLASCLEKKDSVLCAGVFNTRRYTSKKDGTQKEWSEVLLDYLAVQEATPGGGSNEIPHMPVLEDADDETPWDYTPSI